MELWKTCPIIPVFMYQSHAWYDLKFWYGHVFHNFLFEERDPHVIRGLSAVAATTDRA
jgi:hypothetical protein